MSKASGREGREVIEEPADEEDVACGNGGKVEEGAGGEAERKLILTSCTNQSPTVTITAGLPTQTAGTELRGSSSAASRFLMQQ